MKVFHKPTLNKLPPSGGVREHIRHLVLALERLGVQFTTWPHEADIVHVQTAYKPPMNGRIDVWTCHGGFVPPMVQVQENLDAASQVITVASWVAEKYFPQHASKTTVIPNGVDLSEWDDLPLSGIEPGYVLWGKGFFRPDWYAFQYLVEYYPKQRFVTTLTAPGLDTPSNMTVIGVQPYDRMRSIINDCSVYVSTGSEVCPTMILEAWACGKPVLAWNGDGNKELVEVCGALYDDSEGMVSGLKYCLNKDASRAKEHVEQYYTWDIIAKKTLEVYEQCLAT